MFGRYIKIEPKQTDGLKESFVRGFAEQQTTSKWKVTHHVEANAVKLDLFGCSVQVCFSCFTNIVVYFFVLMLDEVSSSQYQAVLEMLQTSAHFLLHIFNRQKVGASKK